VQIIVLAVHLNYETAHRYMKSNVKTNLRSMQVTQERTRHTTAIDGISARPGKPCETSMPRINVGKKLQRLSESVCKSQLPEVV